MDSVNSKYSRRRHQLRSRAHLHPHQKDVLCRPGSDVAVPSNIIPKGQMCGARFRHRQRKSIARYLGQPRETEVNTTCRGQEGGSETRTVNVRLSVCVVRLLFASVV